MGFGEAENPFGGGERDPMSGLAGSDFGCHAGVGIHVPSTIRALSRNLLIRRGNLTPFSNAGDLSHRPLTEQATPPHIADSLLRYYHRAIPHSIGPAPISRILPAEQPRTYRQWIHDHRADFAAS